MIDTVLFDLDGTIVDTNELIIQTHLHILKNEKSIFPDLRAKIISLFGMPLTGMLRELSGREQVSDLIAAYREFNLRMHDEYVKEIPYVHEVLSTLHDQGIQLGIVTSKVRKTTDKVLKLFGLDPYIKAIVTIEDVDFPKPHPQPVLKAMEALGSVPESTIMVGDTSYDILAAQSAGVTSIGVAWSLQGETGLRLFKPDHIIGDMRDLLQLVGVKGIRS